MPASHGVLEANSPTRRQMSRYVEKRECVSIDNKSQEKRSKLDYCDNNERTAETTTKETTAIGLFEHPKYFEVLGSYSKILLTMTMKELGDRLELEFVPMNKVSTIRSHRHLRYHQYETTKHIPHSQSYPLP